MENAIIEIAFQIAILIFSVVIHEVSHGYAALALGDRTAQNEGRLTLNPIPHLDPIGSILLPALSLIMPGNFLIGWAKPVPYNPYNLRNRKWGPAFVGLAGPVANVALALFFGLLYRAAPFYADNFSPLFLHNFLIISRNIAYLNLVLAVFNLIPIPPLDGSKILFALLPYKWRNIEAFLEAYGFILVLFILFTFSPVFSLIVYSIFSLIVGAG